MQNSYDISIHLGTYDGGIMGFRGDLKNIENYYGYVASHNSLRAIASNGRFLFMGGFDEIIRLYDLKKSREVGQLESHEASLTCLKVFKAYLFSGSEDGCVLVWRIKDWALIHKIKAHQDNHVNDLVVHSSGRIMMTMGRDRRLVLWNLLNFKKMYSKKLPNDVFKILFDSSEKYICLMGEKEISLMEIDTNEIKCIMNHDEKLQDIIIYQERFLLSSDDEGSIYVWDINEPSKEIHYRLKYKAHDKRVKSIKIIIQKPIDLLITCSSDGSIKIWDTLELVNRLGEINENKDLDDQVKAIYEVQSKERINCMTALQLDFNKQEEKFDVVFDENQEKQDLQNQMDTQKYIKKGIQDGTSYKLKNKKKFQQNKDVLKKSNGKVMRNAKKIKKETLKKHQLKKPVDDKVKKIINKNMNEKQKKINMVKKKSLKK